MQRRTISILTFIAGGGLAAALVGCGAAGESNSESSAAPESGSQTETEVQQETETENPGSGGQATLSYNDVSYSSELSMCMLQENGEALFHGAAIDDTGADIGYITGDFVGLTDQPTGEARIDFGATGQFESSDEFVAIGDAASTFVVTSFDASDLIIMGPLWDNNGNILATATLKVEC